MTTCKSNHSNAMTKLYFGQHVGACEGCVTLVSMSSFIENVGDVHDVEQQHLKECASLFLDFAVQCVLHVGEHVMPIVWLIDWQCFIMSDSMLASVNCQGRVTYCNSVDVDHSRHCPYFIRAN